MAERTTRLYGTVSVKVVVLTEVEEADRDNQLNLQQFKQPTARDL